MKTLSPITVEDLRTHFKTTYKFNDDQALHMVVSSARSLLASFQAMKEIPDDHRNLAKIAVLAHSLKGLLLNMGQAGWAEYAKEIEVAANAGENRNYPEMIEKIQTGSVEVVKILDQA